MNIAWEVRYIVCVCLSRKYSVVFGAGGTTVAIPSNVSAMSDGSVLIYTASTGPNLCGGAQGDFVIPATVSEDSRSRLLGVALAGQLFQKPLIIDYDGTCIGARHVVFLVQTQ